MVQPLEITDFSGGVTNYYLNAPMNKHKQMDNLLLIQYQDKGLPFTRYGSEIYSSDAPQIPAGAQRISTAFIYRNILHVQSSKKLYWFNTNMWSTISGPTGNDAFNAADTSKVFTYSHWNNHTLIAHSGRWYPQKVIVNTSNQPEILEAGLPQFDVSTTTITPTPGANNWLYKLVYRQDYTVKDDITFTDYGAPSNSTDASSAALPVNFTTIPVLANSTTGNFRTATIKVEIYRTVDAGTVFYKVGEITNGTTTFADNVSDATLQLNQLLYTEGGVVANDRPPKCKLVHIFGDLAYYANIEDSTGQKLTYRVQQSIPGDIDSAPETFFADADDEIVGMSSTKSNLVLLCKNSVYRADGFFDEVGRGSLDLERISDTASCVSAQSVVQALDGLFWAGFDGIYYTDGFRVAKLNGDYDKTYFEFVHNGTTPDQTRQDRIQGKYDKRKNRIWWTIQHESSTDVDKCYILDLTWGVRENATFTTCSGLSSFSPTAIEFSGPDLIRCDRRGYVLLHQENITTDPKIDTGVAASSWVSQTIFYTLESVAFNFGTSYMRKFVTGINITADSTTNLSLQITSNNDDEKSLADLKPIRYRGSIVWGDPDIYWGDPSLVWNLNGLISEKRRMPARNLRCNYKIIKMTNAFVAIINSELIGTASINALTKTVTLTDTVTYDWPSNSVDWYIAFEVDDYIREYLITARTADVLTYSDSSNFSQPATGSKWVIRGYPKNEILNLINYSIHYVILGKTQDVFNKSETGEVGAMD